MRKLAWVESQNLQGFGCSECSWVFCPSGAPLGESLDEMKRKYEAQRDKEFATHVCTKHPRTTSPKSEEVDEARPETEKGGKLEMSKRWTQMQGPGPKAKNGGQGKKEIRK